MLKSKKCLICNRRAYAKLQDYKSGVMDKHGVNEIVVKDVEIYECEHEECKHSWLLLDQERRIDKTIADLMRFDLTSDQIRVIRESLPFTTKYETANFLCLNEKAFVKWENGYTEPNRAYDLLLRLSVFSKQNIAFIKRLHETNFQFNPNDYQLVCDKSNSEWNIEVIVNSGFDSSPKFYPSVTSDASDFDDEGKFVLYRDEVKESGEDLEKAMAA